MKSRALLTGLLLLLPALANASEPAKVTFAEHIAPIVHAKCTMCHRKGQSGPFELVTYEDVRERAATIQAVVHDNYMPPWKPVNKDIQFANDRRLTPKEKSLLDRWVESGMPAGDLASIQPPKYPDGWSLGKPDLVVKMKDAFRVPASGPDVYRSFVFRLDLKEDKWVKAIELRPSARSVVHHALFFLDQSGSARAQEGRDGQPGFRGMSFLSAGSGNRSRGGAGRGFSAGDFSARGLGGYVPGATPNKLPGDLAQLLPKGSDIVMQTHFHPSGKVEWEQTEMAIYFADKPPSRQIVGVQLPPLFGRFAGLDVPAGEKNFKISQSVILPVDVEAISIGGHAHYICREMEMMATLPDGEKMTLMRIDDWDLDWQDRYQFAKPLSLPAGTTLYAEIIYDNSADNPENPYSPPQRIKWGRESNDEMGSVTVQVIAKDETDRPELQRAVSKSLTDAVRKNLPDSIANRLRDRLQSQSQSQSQGQGDNSTLLKRWDANKDGKLQRSEVPRFLHKRIFDAADADGDDVIDADELQKARQQLEGRRR
jgi:hypothetical protein